MQKLRDGMISALFILILFNASLGQLLRASILDGQANFYIHELIIFIFIITILLITRGKIIQSKRTIHKTGIFFLSVLLLPLIVWWPQFAFRENFIASMYLIRLTLYILLVIILFQGIVKQKILSIGIGVYSFITITSGYFQYLLYPEIRNIAYLGWDPHLYRAVGLLFDSSISGSIYALFALYTCARISQCSMSNIIKGKHIPLILQCFLWLGLLFLSYSRIAYISFLVGIVYFLLSRGASRSIPFIFIGLIVVTVMLPRPGGVGVELERTFSITSRITNQTEAITLWQKNPIIGVGYNRIRYVRESEFAGGHAGAGFSSSFLTILTAGGIIGLGAYLLFLRAIYTNVDQIGKSVLIVGIMGSILENILLVNFVFLISSVLLSFTRLNKKQ